MSVGERMRRKRYKEKWVLDGGRPGKEETFKLLVTGNTGFNSSKDLVN